MYLKLLLLLLSVTFLSAYPNISESVKEKKIYPMGEKIYLKRCQEIHPSSYETYESMQKDIQEKSLCKKLSPNHFEALSLYLWDIKRNHIHEKSYKKLTATKHEKCPVCGMYVYKYPAWICRINYKDNSYAFDGIKDMMKYYFKHPQGIQEMLVQDYYTKKTINAKEAFFALGSDVYGPMGNELISFEDEKSAKRFMLDHRAKEVLPFKAITQEKVYKLDE